MLWSDESWWAFLLTLERLGAKIAELQRFLREANAEVDRLRAELQRTHEVIHSHAKLTQEAEAEVDRLRRVHALWEQWFGELKSRISQPWPPEVML